MPFFLYVTECGEVTNSSDISFAPLPVGKAEIDLANPVFDPPWIVKNNNIRTPPPPELSGFPAAQLNVDKLESRAAADNLLSTTDSDLGQVVRALALATLDEVNILRGQHGLEDRTKTQLLSAVSSKIVSGLAD